MKFGQMCQLEQSLDDLLVRIQMKRIQGQFEGVGDVPQRFFQISIIDGILIDVDRPLGNVLQPIVVVGMDQGAEDLSFVRGFRSNVYTCVLLSGKLYFQNVFDEKHNVFLKEQRLRTLWSADIH